MFGPKKDQTPNLEQITEVAVIFILQNPLGSRDHLPETLWVFL